MPVSRLLIVLLVATAAAPSASAQTSSGAVEVIVSAGRVFGLTEFLGGLSPSGRPVPAYARLVAEAGGIPETDALARFRQIDLDAHSYRYSGYPDTHGQTMSPWGLFRLAAARASSLAELRQQTVGLFSNADQAVVLQALHDVSAVYDSLVVRPYGSGLDRQAMRLQAYADEHRVGALVGSLSAFYGAPWPDGLPFRVAAYALPPSRGFRASVVGNVAMTGMPAGFDADSVYASVALHEAAHVLFGQGPPALAALVRDRMLASDSPARRLAYTWLDEGLATAAGNGWAYTQLTGSLDSDPWYNDPVIDAYAHALYPDVAAYLDAGRSLDAAFADAAVAAFDRAVPDALTSADALFSFYSLVSDADDESLGGLLAPLDERFRARGTRVKTPVDAASVDAALATPGLTLILLTDPATERLPAIRERLPSVLLQTPGDAVYTVTFEGQPVLLLRASTPEAVAAALDRLRAGGLRPL